MPPTQIEQIRFDALVRIAQKNFDPALHQGEARAIAHSVAAGSLPVPGQAEPRLPVRPDFLRWLATDSEARTHIDAGGIKVWSAAVPGKVDLRGCTIPFDLHFLGCAFQGPLVLQTAEIRSLWMLGCSTEANIEADGLVSRGSVMMRNLESKGAIRLVNARISNTLDLKGADLRCNGTALALDGADVHGSVFLDDGFKCSGEVRMLNARIDGDFGCNGAQFTSTQAALSLDKVVIHGNASLTGGFVSSGLIRFSGAHIYGDVDFKGAVLTASIEALNLNTTAIDGHIYLREGFESAGLVSLQYSRIGNTVDCGGGKFSCPTTSLRLEAMSARHVYLSHGFSAAGLVELQSADINGDLNCDQCCMPALYCPNARIGGDLIWTSVQKPGQTKLCLNKTTVGTIKDDRQSWPSAGSHILRWPLLR